MRGRGGRARVAVAVLTIVLGTALLTSGGAAARGGHTFVIPGSPTSFGFVVHHGGYRLELHTQEEGIVFLAVSRGSRAPAENIYFTRGRVSEDGDIDAGFGGLGKVKLAFRPLGKPRSETGIPQCHGRPTLNQHGVFTGTFRFRGEGGFVTVRAGRVKGISTTSFRQECNVGGESEKPTRRFSEAELTASDPHGRIEFSAYGIKGPTSSAAFFSADSLRRVGGAMEFRFVNAQGRDRAFEFDEGLTTATVRPGGPFEGSATFERGAGGVVTWSGDLRVDFLGGSAPLTGGGIEATLKRPHSSGFGGGFFAQRLRSGRRAFGLVSRARCAARRSALCR